MWCELTKDNTIRLRLAVQPGAKRTTIVGEYDHCLKIKIAAPPVDGAANEEVLTFMAGLLGLKHRQIKLVSGQMSRRKTLELQGISLTDVHKIIMSSLPASE